MAHSHVIAGEGLTQAPPKIRTIGISDLTDALAEQARGATTTYGKPADDEDAWVPPVNNVNQMERVLSFFTDVPSHAKVAIGGQRQGDKGFYVEPTVIGGLRQDDRLIQNEIFGPVITVQSFSDEDEAIQWANGTEFALAQQFGDVPFNMIAYQIKKAQRSKVSYGDDNGLTTDQIDFQGNITVANDEVKLAYL